MTTRIALAVTALLAILAVFAAPTRAVAWYAGGAQQCFAADNNDDGVIDAVDMQRAVAHYNGGFASDEHPERYDPLFDIWPNLTPDGHIDIRDLQFVFGRFGMTCPPAKEYWMWNGGMYSYGDACADGDHIDPVTTVIRYRGDAAAATLDGIGLTHTTDTQHFLDVGNCVAGDVGQADHDAWNWCGIVPCAATRWHARGNVNSQPDPGGGTFAHLTPHWDSSDGTITFDECVHFVAEVYDGPENFPGMSGFDAGKDWLYGRLVVENNHTFEGAQYWDNRLENQQCADGAADSDDENDWTGSNGWVNIIDG